MKVLVTTHGIGMGTVDGQQMLGLQRAKSSVEERADCELVFQEARSPDEIRSAVAAAAPRVIVMVPDWKWPAEMAELLCADLQARGVHVVYVDYYAPANSPHFSVLPFVHTYLKRQLLRDVAAYQKPLIGGTPFTDYLHRHMNIDCEGWGFKTRLDRAFEDRLRVGWNLGACERYRAMSQLTKPASIAWGMRPYQFNARLGTATINQTSEWYEKYRVFSMDRVKRMDRKLRMPGYQRVGLRRYHVELVMSRIVFSPFGWGEVCFRDYEAVGCGALLLKPSMDHLVTEPNIYQAGRTYVPVKWDLSDLDEKVDWALSHPKESAEIVRNAQNVMIEFFANDRIAEIMTSVLRTCR